MNPKKKIDHSYQSEIVCPYCGWKHTDSWEHEGDRSECSNCEREFAVESHTEITYTTIKLAICDECGQKAEVRQGLAGVESLAIHSKAENSSLIRCVGSRKAVK